MISDMFNMAMERMMIIYTGIIIGSQPDFTFLYSDQSVYFIALFFVFICLSYYNKGKEIPKTERLLLIQELDSNSRRSGSYKACNLAFLN